MQEVEEEEEQMQEVEEGGQDEVRLQLDRRFGDCTSAAIPEAGASTSVGTQRFNVANFVVEKLNEGTKISHGSFGTVYKYTADAFTQALPVSVPQVK
jgi:hypothetical protein